MKELSILDQRDFEPTVDIAARRTYYIRRAARAVVTDNDNCVALLYSKTRNYYKLPGGGIEENEDVLEALKREVLEELGCAIDITGELGEVTEWRDTEQMKQISYCFTAKQQGTKDSPVLLMKKKPMVLKRSGYRLFRHLNVWRVRVIMMS